MTDSVKKSTVVDSLPSVPDASNDEMSHRGLLVITPAHNEAGTLRALAKSIKDQTVRPALWVMVDDRSQDSTFRVATEIANELDFAVAIAQPSYDLDRTFTGKVRAFMAAYEQFGGQDHGFVACVDADVTLPKNYFERVVAELLSHPDLGITGGVYVDPEGRVGRHGGGSVPGPAQVFRHSTFEAIDGFRALPYGGEDSLACTHARARGWDTRALPDLKFWHLREMGAGGGRSRLKAAFDHGRQDWDVGMAPTFEMLRLIPRMRNRPFVLSAVVRGVGYAVGLLGRQRTVDEATVKFTRSEERRRMLGAVRRLDPRGSSSGKRVS